MARISTRTLSGAGSSDPVILNLAKFVGPGLYLTFGAGATGTVNVEVTGDDPSTGLVNWNVHDTLGAKTASANGYQAAPATAVRLSSSSLTGGVVTLTVVQPTS